MGQARGRRGCWRGVATGSWAEGLALQVNLLTWWLWLAAGGVGPPRSSEKPLEPGCGDCDHLKGEMGGRMGSWREQATPPAHLHQPPWGLGEHVFGWETVSWAPITPPHSLVGHWVKAH